MICPNNNSKDFDDLECRDCQWYWACFSMWQDGNVWGKEEPIGDNFPTFNEYEQYLQDRETLERHKQYQLNNHPNLDKDGNPRTFKVNFITKEEVEKFKIELSNIIFFSEWEKKFKNEL